MHPALHSSVLARARMSDSAHPAWGTSGLGCGTRPLSPSLEGVPVDPNRFDALSRRFAAEYSRRRALKSLAGGAAGRCLRSSVCGGGSARTLRALSPSLRCLSEQPMRAETVLWMPHVERCREVRPAQMYPLPEMPEHLQGHDLHRQVPGPVRALRPDHGHLLAHHLWQSMLGLPRRSMRRRVSAVSRVPRGHLRSD